MTRKNLSAARILAKIQRDAANLATSFDDLSGVVEQLELPTKRLRESTALLKLVLDHFDEHVELDADDKPKTERDNAQVHLSRHIISWLKTEQLL